MTMTLPLLILLLSSLMGVSRGWMHCEQKWDDVKGPHIVGDYYHVKLLKINTTEEFKSFMPNTKYQVMISPTKDPDSTFARFHLTVENENKTLSPGFFELFDPDLTEFAQECPEVVSQVSNVLKNDVSVYWTSPEEGNGCVIFRGMVMESQERWYMDGSLEQKICQDPKALIDDPGPELPECCACDEAKYEITFEGLWSRYTHPKNFPSNPWNAGFSDVIGASHTSDYHFWKYNRHASEGLKQVAESGITRILESELKNKSAHIRTIIKAKGINFPNITSKTFAVFRVDQRHHLISLVSMIDPSPDWFVGVSGLELCMTNCSWVEHKELNLYPVDAGTDSGISYEAVDVPTIPQEPVRRITTTWPENENSPFYDPTAIDMNPLARLYLNRQRIYEKGCGKQPESENGEGDDSKDYEEITDKACNVTPWGPWQPCSVTCGRGHKLRQRNYANEQRASRHNCNSRLTDRVACSPKGHLECPPDEVNDPNCELTQWGDWTPCTRRCGPESRTRDRKFRPKKRRKQCRANYPKILLQQTESCYNPRCKNVDKKEEEEEEGGGGGGGDEADENEDKGEEEQEGGNAEKEEEEAGENKEEEAEEETFSPDTSEEQTVRGLEGDEPEEAAPNDDDTTTTVGEEDEEAANNEDSMEAAESAIMRRQRQQMHALFARGIKRPPKNCVESRYTPWSFWTPCSVSCGTGTKTRSRSIKPDYNNSPEAEKDLSLYECQFETVTCEAPTKSCKITKELIAVICSQPDRVGSCLDGHNDNSLRYYFDRRDGRCKIFRYSGCNGNMNNFRTMQDCQDTCGKFFDGASLRNYKLKVSRIASYSAPLGFDRDSLTMKKREKCVDEEKESTRDNEKRRKKKLRSGTNDSRQKIDCKVSEWSDWSPCYSCKGYRTMNRNVLVEPRNGGKACPMKMMKRQRCQKVLPECAEPGTQNDEVFRRSINFHDQDDAKLHFLN